MTNLARFTIAGTPSSQGGYDVSPSATPVLALEASSSLVGRVTFECVTATDGAPLLTLDNGVQQREDEALDAVTPSSTVTISAGIPTVRAPHLWHIRCKVNGGTNPDGSVNPDYVFSRFIAMRSVGGARKILYSERGEYSPTEAWSGAFNELVSMIPDNTRVPGTLALNANKTFAVSGTADVVGKTHVFVTASAGADIQLLNTGAEWGNVVSFRVAYDVLDWVVVFKNAGGATLKTIISSDGVLRADFWFDGSDWIYWG